MLPAKSISIHVWGGLGSQLYSIALLLDLQQKFPSRQIGLNLHNGGVTSRMSEIDNIFPEVNIATTLDFKEKLDLTSGNSKSRITAIGFLKKGVSRFFRFIGVINTCDGDRDFSRTKPWLISTRGHYSYRSISAKSLKHMSNRILGHLDSRHGAENLNQTLAIHYRLGDLMHLTEKSPISVEQIGTEIQEIVKRINPAKVVLFSDSPKSATALLEHFLDGKHIVTKDVPAVEVMRQAFSSKYFIGSNSKISFWIVCLRLLNLRGSMNSLPSGNQMNWIRCSDYSLDYSNVREY
jgi:hypothetical protein